MPTNASEASLRRSPVSCSKLMFPESPGGSVGSGTLQEASCCIRASTYTSTLAGLLAQYNVAGLGRTARARAAAHHDARGAVCVVRHAGDAARCRDRSTAHPDARRAAAALDPRHGNRYLKIAFSHAAIRAIQYFPEIRAFYRARARRKPPVVARAVVAKELARIVYYVLARQEAFNGTFKDKPLSRTKSPQWPRLASPPV
jgi:hypothetical protein